MRFGDFKSQEMNLLLGYIPRVNCLSRKIGPLEKPLPLAQLAWAIQQGASDLLTYINQMIEVNLLLNICPTFAIKMSSDTGDEATAKGGFFNTF